MEILIEPPPRQRDEWIIKVMDKSFSKMRETHTQQFNSLDLGLILISHPTLLRMWEQTHTYPHVCLCFIALVRGAS